MNDLLWIAAVAAVFAIVAIAFSRRRRIGITDYLVARGQLGPVTLAASAVASGLGAWILFSPPETGAVWGIVAVVGYALGAAAPFVAFLWLAPRIRGMMPRGHSITEYVWHRYGRVLYAAVLFITVFYMFVFLAAELTGIAIAVNLVAGVPLWATALVVATATVAYTAYGGLPASVFTDRLQAFLIAPLVIVAFAVLLFAVGGPGAVAQSLAEARPELLDAGHVPGGETAVALVIAVLAANLFHQGYWQRTFAGRDDRALRQGFALAAIVSALLVLAVGLVGLFAVSVGAGDVPSVALFALVQATTPPVVMTLVLVLGVVLVMSSLDTLLNGLASVFASDLHRLRPGIGAAGLLRFSRAATVVLAAAAVAVATQGLSVLYLFLVADLVCAAAMVPVFAGLFTGRLDGRGATASFAAGLVAGALLFPLPDFSPWTALPMAGSLMASFVVAVAVSSALTLAFVALGRPRDLARLSAISEMPAED